MPDANTQLSDCMLFMFAIFGLPAFYARCPYHVHLQMAISMEIDGVIVPGFMAPFEFPLQMLKAES